MNIQTKIGLLRSISRHELNLKAEHPIDVKIGSCELCTSAYRNVIVHNMTEHLRINNRCRCCPIVEKYGSNCIGCEHTPYFDLDTALSVWFLYIQKNLSNDRVQFAKEKFVKYEKEEIKFLRSFL